MLSKGVREGPACAGSMEAISEEGETDPKPTEGKKVCTILFSRLASII